MSSPFHECGPTAQPKIAPSSRCSSRYSAAFCSSVTPRGSSSADAISSRTIAPSRTVGPTTRYPASHSASTREESPSTPITRDVRGDRASVGHHSRRAYEGFGQPCIRTSPAHPAGYPHPTDGCATLTGRPVAFTLAGMTGTLSETHERRRIRARGVVQGVGFRPFVHRLATARRLDGFVLNDGEGVVIEVEGPASVLDDFVEALELEAPRLARIDAVTSERVARDRRARLRRRGESCERPLRAHPSRRRHLRRLSRGALRPG